MSIKNKYILMSMLKNAKVYFCYNDEEKNELMQSLLSTPKDKSKYTVVYCNRNCQDFCLTLKFGGVVNRMVWQDNRTKAEEAFANYL